MSENTVRRVEIINRDGVLVVSSKGLPSMLGLSQFVFDELTTLLWNSPIEYLSIWDLLVLQLIADLEEIELTGIETLITLFSDKMNQQQKITCLLALKYSQRKT